MLNPRASVKVTFFAVRPKLLHIYMYTYINFPLSPSPAAGQPPSPLPASLVAPKRVVGCKGSGRYFVGYSKIYHNVSRFQKLKKWSSEIIKMPCPSKIIQNIQKYLIFQTYVWFTRIYSGFEDFRISKTYQDSTIRFSVFSNRSIFEIVSDPPKIKKTGFVVMFLLGPTCSNMFISNTLR